MNYHFEGKEGSISVSIDQGFVRVLQGIKVQEFDLGFLQSLERKEDPEAHRVILLPDGKKLTYFRNRSEIFLHLEGETWSAKLIEKDFSLGGDGSPEIKSPMPGKLIQVLCEKDKTYKTGESLLILEAMKMENLIKAPYPCRILECKKQVGEIVSQDEVLLILQRIEPEKT